MSEIIETPNTIMKTEITSGYMILSYKIAELSAAMTPGTGHMGIAGINASIKTKLVYLASLGMTNETFASAVGPTLDRYRAGKPLVKHRAMDFSALRSAKDTMKAWKVVSNALIASKLVTLQD